MTQSLESRKLLMVSGGDGYIDFRLGRCMCRVPRRSVGEDDDNTDDATHVNVRDMSHLIVWEEDAPNPSKTGPT